MIWPSDPKANYLAHKAEIDVAINRVLASGCYVLGEQVTSFEREFAHYIGVAYAVGVASGTDALELALRAAAVGAGDEVITVSHTAVATVAAIERAGATPVLVDIDPQSFTLDPSCLASAITSRTKAIVPVHLYGHPASMPAIRETAQKHQLVVIEDSAQAHGAAILGRKVGAWGQAGIFSFYPTKNLGGIGDGGAFVTNNKEYAERVRELREYGWRERYVSEHAGVNSRLDELQAAVLRVKLRHLEVENNHRRGLAAIYNAALRSTNLTLPTVAADCQHVYHQYVIRSEQRERLRMALEKQGVATQIHYPVPVHRQPAYQRLHADCPVSERIAGEILSLPMHAQLDRPDVERICEFIVAGCG